MPIVNVPVAGLAGPWAETPERVPGSARRTSHVDVEREGAGWDAEAVVTGRGRDVVTGPGGRGRPVDEVALEIRVAGPGGILAHISSEPAEPGLEALVGVPLMAGFRRAVAQALPEHVRVTSLLYRLLDDAPLAFLVSGHSLMLDEPDVDAAVPASVARSPGSGPARRGPGIDVCAGWQTGGMLVECLADGGTIPHSLGPPAPVLAVADDPLAWHDRPPVRPLVTRRTRRLDVVSPLALGPVRIDAHFRDSYGFTDGTERSLHEYTIEAEVDPVSRTVTSAQAVPRALPWPECPQAADSAARLGGLVLDDLAELVRRQFTGITTCTHLNDTMRSLADGAALLGLATSGTPGAGQQRARG